MKQRKLFTPQARNGGLTTQNLNSITTEHSHTFTSPRTTARHPSPNTQLTLISVFNRSLEAVTMADDGEERVTKPFKFVTGELSAALGPGNVASC